MATLYIVAALLLLLAAVAVFASQNAHLVAVNLLAWHFTWPLAVIVLVTTAAGAILVALAGLVRQVGLSLKVHDASGRLRRAEKDLATVKAELEKTKAALTEKDQALVAAKAELAVAIRELEEARREAIQAAARAGGGPEGGGHAGPGPRRT